LLCLLGRHFNAGNGQDSIFQLALDIDTLTRKTVQGFLVGDGYNRLVGANKDQLRARSPTFLTALSADFGSALFVADPTIKARRRGALCDIFPVIALSCRCSGSNCISPGGSGNLFFAAELLDLNNRFDLKVLM
jgi:hypothetical protein